MTPQKLLPCSEVVHKSYFDIPDFKHGLCDTEFRTEGCGSKPCVIRAKLTQAAVVTLQVLLLHSGRQQLCVFGGGNDWLPLFGAEIP